MSGYHLHALPGFLGSAKDWNFLSLASLKAYELFTRTAEATSLDFTQWARHFNRLARPSLHSSSVLMGYSLGGRLGLHALLEQPDRWKAAILISTHYGLPSVDLCQKRIAEDALWSTRFLQEPWENLMKSWDARDVFSGGNFTFQRAEADYCRKALAFGLQEWSLGKQKNLKSLVEHLEIPILWIVGEKDMRFKPLGESLRLKNKKSEVWIAPQAGHRVPWDQPIFFENKITNFLDEVIT